MTLGGGNIDISEFQIMINMYFRRQPAIIMQNGKINAKLNSVAYAMSTTQEVRMSAQTAAKHPSWWRNPLSLEKLSKPKNDERIAATSTIIGIFDKVIW